MPLLTLPAVSSRLWTYSPAQILFKSPLYFISCLQTGTPPVSAAVFSPSLMSSCVHWEVATAKCGKSSIVSSSKWFYCSPWILKLSPNSGHFRRTTLLWWRRFLLKLFFMTSPSCFSVDLRYNSLNNGFDLQSNP